jgi:hypothetical protein
MNSSSSILSWTFRHLDSSMQLHRSVGCFSSPLSTIGRLQNGQIFRCCAMILLWYTTISMHRWAAVHLEQPDRCGSVCSVRPLLCSYSYIKIRSCFHYHGREHQFRENGQATDGQVGGGSTLPLNRAEPTHWAAFLTASIHARILD